MSDLLAALRAALGEAHVLVPSSAQDADFTRFHQDWRGRYLGQALAVARPANTEEVAQVVRLCAAHGTSIVPQGGNTGLVGAGVPDASGRQVVLSLQRLDRILDVNPTDMAITVEAGCLLANVQQAADDAGLLFPLSLASEGSCTIGGNLATNAGGTQVLRYGTARELCLGLEAVTAQGDIWQGLRSLRKDNSGYDLRDLLIGSEGTLGIITAATLKLYPRPVGRATALVTCPSLEQPCALLQVARQTLDPGLTACEIMAALPLRLVLRHHPDVGRVLHPLIGEAVEQSLPPWIMLLENVSHESDTHAQERLQALLQSALHTGLAGNAALALSQAQRTAMWLLRETVPLSERREGLMVKHDIGVPTSAVAAFVRETDTAILARWPDARIVCFGHLGDGNLHYNVQPPATATSLDAFEQEVNTLVFDQVDHHAGTLSAEHGIGVLRCQELARRKSPAAMAMMRAIKQALDPAGTLNPGRVLVR